MLTRHADSKGDYLDGGKTYKITLPAPIPAGQFWSFMVYDGQTRSMLETDQKLAGLDSNQHGHTEKRRWLGDSVVRSQGAGRARNQSGADYAGQRMEFAFAALRAAEPWFDKTWKPGDFERVD